jgi:hypothetical protein
MLKAQGVPEDTINMFLGIIEKNPELFQKMAASVQENIKSGMSQEMATQKVMEQYGDELRKLKGE